MIASLISQPMNALETRLHELVQSDVEFIQLIGEDLVNAGGKRARPQLVFLAASLPKPAKISINLDSR